MKPALLMILAAALLLATLSRAQAPQNWKDAFVDHLAGNWKIDGELVGRPAHHDVRAEWVLNHQFLRIEEKTSADAPKSESRYDAVWFLGYDDVRKRYVLHLMDVYGARYSETLGYGKREGDEIRFVFEYPDGPFHTTFRWIAEKNLWEWLMQQKDKNGNWAPFADLKLTQPPTP
jgi:hypothetical protein